MIKFLKIMILALAFLSFSDLDSIAQAKDVYVKGYYRKDGTYVKPHYRSAPNHTKSDNWSSFGNVNPHTGKIGTKTYDNDSNYNSRSYNNNNNYDPYGNYQNPYGSDYDTDYNYDY